MTLSALEVKLVIAQLKKREGLTMSKLAKQVGVDFGELTGYIHRGVHMDPDKHNRLISFLKVRMEKYGRTDRPLLTDRHELIEREGFGFRIGASVRPDDSLRPVSERLLAIHRSGTSYRALAKQIGVNPECVGRLANGQLKRLNPENRKAIMDWYNSLDDEREQPTPPVVYWAEDRLNPEEPMLITDALPHPPTGFDAELEAIRQTLGAIRDLPSGAQIRVLKYCRGRIGASA